jgi:hypothetical protein
MPPAFCMGIQYLGRITKNGGIAAAAVFEIIKAFICRI